MDAEAVWRVVRPALRVARWASALRSASSFAFFSAFCWASSLACLASAAAPLRALSSWAFSSPVTAASTAATRVFSAAVVTAEATSAVRSRLRTGISSVVSATGSADGDALAVAGHGEGAEDATGNSGADRELRGAAAGLPVAGYVSGVGHGTTAIRAQPLASRNVVCATVAREGR